MTDEDIENLLPWYVNNTLSEEERAQVEALLARSEHARDEEAFLRSLAQQINTETAAPVSDLGWRRLQKDIAQQRKNKRHNWRRTGLAAAATVILSLQLGILMDRDDSDMDTRLLGNDGAALQQPHWIVQLEFAADSNWQQLSALLQKMDAVLVDGPSSLGLVRIAVPQEQPQFNDETELLAWLQQQQPIVHAALESE